MSDLRPIFEATGGNCIIASRRTRQDEEMWNTTRSCLGGEPLLDKYTSAYQSALHCVAQLDLAEITALDPPFEMPSEGLLAFMVDTTTFKTGKILVVPKDGNPDDQYAYKRPPYGEYWDQHLRGNCSEADAPRHFRRWPLTFTKAYQSGNEFYPSLESVFGPVAKYVHLNVKGMVAGEEKYNWFYAEEDASPFPVLAARKILNEAIHLTHKLLSGGVKHEDVSVAAHLSNFQKRIPAAQEILPILEKWDGVLQNLNLNAPLGSDLGSKFTEDLLKLRKAFSQGPERLHFRMGSGCTITAGAALSAYFEMYAGSREAYEAIPKNIRQQIETYRMRTAFAEGRLVHQLFGDGAGIQWDGPDTSHKIMLLQVATDEAVEFMWADAGVLQFWISPEDLAVGNWSNVVLQVQGH